MDLEVCRSPEQDEEEEVAPVKVEEAQLDTTEEHSPSNIVIRVLGNPEP